jgi:hypothetical protein
MCSQLGLLCFHVQFCLGMKLQMVINPLHFPSLPFEVNSRQPSAFYVNPSWRWLACSEQSSTMPLELKIATSYQHKTAMNFLQHPTFRTNRQIGSMLQPTLWSLQILTRPWCLNLFAYDLYKFKSYPILCSIWLTRRYTPKEERLSNSVRGKSAIICLQKDQRYSYMVHLIIRFSE